MTTFCVGVRKHVHAYVRTCLQGGGGSGGGSGGSSGGNNNNNNDRFLHPEFCAAGK